VLVDAAVFQAFFRRVADGPAGNFAFAFPRPSALPLDRGIGHSVWVSITLLVLLDRLVIAPVIDGAISTPQT
jgi:hypothetical protein